MVLRLSLYSSQSLWWHSDLPYTHHSLPIGSDNPYTHHSFPGCTQTIPLLITASLVALRLYLYSSQYFWWLRPFLYSYQSLWWYSDYPYTHHRLPDGTQTIPLLITVSLVALRLSLYLPQSNWCLRNLYTHHSLPSGTQTIPLLITVSIVVLKLSLYSSGSLWWYSDYLYTHHGESSCWSSVYPYPHHTTFGGTQTNPIRIIVSLVVLRLSPYSPQSTWWLRQSLYSSQSPSWYPDYPFFHYSLPGGTQTIHIVITVSLVVLRLSLYSSQSPW